MLDIAEVPGSQLISSCPRVPLRSAAMQQRCNQCGKKIHKISGWGALDKRKHLDVLNLPPPPRTRTHHHAATSAGDVAAERIGVQIRQGLKHGIGRSDLRRVDCDGPQGPQGNHNDRDRCGGQPAAAGGVLSSQCHWQCSVCTFAVT